MTTSPEPTPDWRDALADRFWARWRLWVVVVALVFALNSLAGVLAGSLGLIAFAHRIAGRALRARRMVEEARRIVADSDDLRA